MSDKGWAILATQPAQRNVRMNVLGGISKKQTVEHMVTK